MARIRFIKPEFFDDADVADLSFAARLLFVGLWLQADREGRLVADLRRLKARIFPFDDVDMDTLAGELLGKDMIRRYGPRQNPATPEHAGEKRGEPGFFWIRTFLKHQRPHLKEPASLIPPPPDGPQDAGEKPGEDGKSPSRSAGFLSLDSGSLDSGSLDSESRASGAVLSSRSTVVRESTPQTPAPAPERTPLKTADLTRAVKGMPGGKDQAQTAGFLQTPNPTGPPPSTKAQALTKLQKKLARSQEPPDFAQIRRCAREAIALVGPHSLDLPETTKELCAKADTHYNAGLVQAAIEAELSLDAKNITPKDSP